MCGITGIIGSADDTFVPDLKRMKDALQHRGPDSDGLWIDLEAYWRNPHTPVIHPTNPSCKFQDPQHWVSNKFTQESIQMMDVKTYLPMPREYIERPKKGFGIPLEKWVRGPMVGSLINPAVLKHQGLLDPDIVNSCWQNIKANPDAGAEFISSILIFQQWLDSERTSV